MWTRFFVVFFSASGTRLKSTRRPSPVPLCGS